MRAGLFPAALLSVALAACGAGEATPRLTVGVASSMTEAMEALGTAHEEATLELSVAGSQVLVAQAREGAPLDVVITADAATAQSLAELGLLSGDPIRFAGNRLAIAVRPGNPLGLAGPSDLADDAITLVLASPDVPAGAYTQIALGNAGIELAPDSLEPSVRAVLAKVRLGEADAGIVYATDLTAGGVDGVAMPPEANLTTDYFAVVLEGGRTDLAARFVAFLQTPQAQTILADLGFGS
ncbi:MAG: molybdate ABC transporter substrate-binding protein [Acidimicrobiia bacterium]